MSNGINLGFEIVERDKTKLRFFYFTDEDISEGGGFPRALGTNKGELVEPAFDQLRRAASGSRRACWHSVIDEGECNNQRRYGVSALLGTFFRVGARIAIGAWKEADTKALLSAIRFNDKGAENRALSLHRVLVEKYTDRILFGLNQRQNEQLFLEEQVLALNQTVKLLAAKGDTYVMGDNYKVSGQAGAVGPNAHAHDMTFNQIVSQMEKSVDLSELAKELSELRQAISEKQDSSPQTAIALGKVAEAEIAARKRNAFKSSNI